MSSRSVSTDPIWLGIASPKPQPRVKQNSMFGHVVDAFDEKTIVKIGEVTPYEKRIKAREEAERKKELEEKLSMYSETSNSDDGQSISGQRKNDDGLSAERGSANGSCHRVEDRTEIKKLDSDTRIDAKSTEDDSYPDMADYLLLQNGKIINDDHTINADMLIKDGKISAIGKDLKLPGNIKIINVEGKYVMPGGIDLNTHFGVNHLGCQSVDDFSTGTRAAIYGGTTLIVDCVVPDDNQSYLQAYDNWFKKTENSFCNFAARLALTWWSDDVEKEVESLVKEKGVNLFVLLPGTKFSDMELHKIFHKLKQLQCLLQVHPGDADLLIQKSSEVFSEGVTGPEGCLLSYPEEIETAAIYKYVTLASQIGLPIYITTVSSRSAAELVAKKRKEGKVLFAEVTPASLVLDGSRILDSDWVTAAGHVTNPPIRLQNYSYLIDLLANGDLHVVSSDHRSFTTEQKAMGQNDFRLIPPGVSSVEERIKVTWSAAVASGKMDPCRFVTVISSLPAKLLNLYPQKGRLAVGSDADLFVLDTEKVEELQTMGRQSRNDFCVFDGMKINGGISTVVKDGVAVVERGDDGKRVENLKISSSLSCLPGIETGFEKLRLKDKAANGLKPVEREPYSGPVSGMDDSPSSRTPSHAAGTRSGVEQPFCRPPTRSGGRNMQDTTLSISVEGTYADDPIKCQKLGGYRVNQPPGGRTTQFW